MNFQFCLNLSIWFHEMGMGSDSPQRWWAENDRVWILTSPPQWPHSHNNRLGGWRTRWMSREAWQVNARLRIVGIKGTEKNKKFIRFNAFIISLLTVSSFCWILYFLLQVLTECLYLLLLLDILLSHHIFSSHRSGSSGSSNRSRGRRRNRRRKWVE